MPFVKLDCGILDSSLWVDREAREVFMTALLMARPVENEDDAEQIEVRSSKPTGFVAPAGRYGLVEAAGVGIVRRAGLDKEPGLDALERLGQPEADSRTPDHDGRRLIRIDGGFLVLNFAKYRDKDHTTAARSKRYRERKASRRDEGESRRDSHTEPVTSRKQKQKQKQKPEGEERETPPYPTRLPGEAPLTTNARNLTHVLDDGFAMSFTPTNYTYQAAERLVANEKATIDEIAQVLAAWNGGRRVDGVEKLKMFQVKTWPRVRAACLGETPQEDISAVDRILGGS